MKPSVLLSEMSAACLAIEPPGSMPVVHDLAPLHDAAQVLINPHKGWYHHYPDNHINKYLIKSDADLLDFPGMDHLYIRLAWAYLEPREGQFNWAVIDDLIAKWTAPWLLWRPGDATAANAVVTWLGPGVSGSIDEGAYTVAQAGHLAPFSVT